MSIAICHGPNGKGAPHAPLLLYAGTGESAMQAEQDASGYYVTRRRYDGVIDTSGLEDAECDDSPACAECICEIDHWEGTT